MKMSGNEIKQRTVYVLTRKDKANDDDTDLYIGSRSQPLKERLRCHWKDAIRPGNENNRLYVRMNAIGLDKWEILPLLSRMCDIKTIREVERKWVRILSADLNSYSPVTDQKEYKAAYYEKNRESILQYMITYYKDNK